MKTLRKFIEWCDDLNETPLGDVLAWTFFCIDFLAVWLFTFMIAG